MNRRVRYLLVSSAVVGLESYLFLRYAELGALFHFWLHGLFGAAIGWAVLALVQLRRTRDRRSARSTVWVAALIGHLYSAAPDVLFLTLDQVHQPWMDLFALHIGIHFLPAPLLTTFTVFSLALAAWASAVLGGDRMAMVLLAAVVALTGIAWVARDAPPATLEELRQSPQLALACLLSTPAEPPAAAGVGRTPQPLPKVGLARSNRPAPALIGVPSGAGAFASLDGMAGTASE